MAKTKKQRLAGSWDKVTRFVRNNALLASTLFGASVGIGAGKKLS